MRGTKVPRSKYNDIAPNSILIRGFDYLEAPIAGFPNTKQIKFNPKAYPSLKVILP
jgi:hypothetical protein